MDLAIMVSDSEREKLQSVVSESSSEGEWDFSARAKAYAAWLDRFYKEISLVRTNYKNSKKDLAK